MKQLFKILLPPLSAFFKRSFDLIFSSLLLLLFSPLLICIAILIKYDSKGPLFYKGKRLGKGGKHIEILKFRTMHVDAEKRLFDLLSGDVEKQKEWNTYQKLHEDPRCTKFGKFLRRNSLDEFPQFFNVILGDLSVVGPRPHYIEELEGNRESPLKKYAQEVLSVKPGITGLWQISGRSHLSYQDRVELDRLYAMKRSFIYDLKVVVMTIPHLLMSKGGAV